LAAIRKAQEEAYGPGKTKAVIRAVLTRWTARYQAYCLLLELRAILLSIVTTDATRPESKQVMVTGDAKSKAHAWKIVWIISDVVFWQSIAR
jgi:hypothetical protein